MLKRFFINSVHHSRQKPKTHRCTLAVPALEVPYENDINNNGKSVLAIHLTNPKISVSDMYTAQKLMEPLGFPRSYHIHLTSMCDSETTFTNILTLPHLDLERVHFLRG